MKLSTKHFFYHPNQKKNGKHMFLSTFYIRVQNFSYLKAIIKCYRYSFLIKKNEKIVILNISVTSIEKSIQTKYVYFHVLHTCMKSQQPRGNSRKVKTTISASIGCPEKILIEDIQRLITFSMLKLE